MRIVEQLVKPLAKKPFKISTSRLILREFDAQDAEALFRLNSNPDVLRYTGDEPFPDVEAADDFITNYTHYHQHGFGRWAVTSLETGDFMGFCGLRRSGSTGDVDLGFRLFQRYWAQGYATEAARAAMSAGFDQFGLDFITGRVMRENLPSITVLQKLGMQFRELSEENELIWLIYAITADEFRRRDSAQG